MSIREAINNDRTVGIAAAAGILLTAAVVIGWQVFAGSPRASGRKAFYSDDGGKTWFVDAADKPSPFDHQGKPAYRAAVFRRDGKELFVAYLMKTPESTPAAPADVHVQSLSPVAMEIEKPGTDRWLSVNGGAHPTRDGPLTGKAAAEAAAFNNLMYPTTPPGSTLQQVSPAEPDNGAQPN